MKVVQLSALLVLVACEGTVAPGAGVPAIAPADASSDAPTDAPVPATRLLQNADHVRYLETPFGQPWCAYRSEAFDLDFAAGTLRVRACEGIVDAGEPPEQVILLTATDVSDVRGLLQALVQDPAAAATPCSGFDGTKRTLELTEGQSPPYLVGFEFNCSDPVLRPDVRVDRLGFVALRAKLYVLAGLDPAMRPT